MELLCERLVRYRELAAKARNSALSSRTVEVREAFGAVARSWDVLAGEIEERLAATPPVALVPEARHRQQGD